MKSKRKLKGKDKKKKEETIKQDSINLRNILEQKLKWAIAEKTKGVNAVEKFRIQVERLNGIIIALKDILEPKKEEKK